MSISPRACMCGARGAHLRPVRRERVHVHRVQPAREALVERAERVAEVPEPLCIGLERFGLIDELCECGLEEAEAVRRVGVRG